MTTTCSACGQPGTGRFCAQCGASLGAPVSCTACGNPIPAGGRFCNACGQAVAAPGAAAASPSRGASAIPWAVAGLATLGLVAALLTRGRGEEEAPAAAAPFAAAGQAAAGDPGAIDLSAMTPRERADRLFDRVMREAEGGDSTRARFFLPMALEAYRQVPELDADARYHLGVLHLFGGDGSAARAQADTLLAGSPDHLFGLYVAARADEALGDRDRALARFQRFLQVYDREIAGGRPEYTAHQQALDIMRQDANRAADSL